MKREQKTMDGNQAAAYVAYAYSEQRSARVEDLVITW